VSVDKLMFHGDRARLGWNSHETDLTPARVGSDAFGSLWNSEPFDTFALAGRTYVPRMYATPLYIDNVRITGGAYDGMTASVVLAATSNAWVYAVNAFAGTYTSRTVPAGAVLWRTRRGTPG